MLCGHASHRTNSLCQLLVLARETVCTAPGICHPCEHGGPSGLGAGKLQACPFSHWRAGVPSRAQRRRPVPGPCSAGRACHAGSRRFQLCCRHVGAADVSRGWLRACQGCRGMAGMASCTQSQPICGTGNRLFQWLLLQSLPGHKRPALPAQHPCVPMRRWELPWSSTNPWQASCGVLKLRQGGGAWSHASALVTLLPYCSRRNYSLPHLMQYSIPNCHTFL